MGDDVFFPGLGNTRDVKTGQGIQAKSAQADRRKEKKKKNGWEKNHNVFSTILNRAKRRAS